jgi:hypothetical protein
MTNNEVPPQRQQDWERLQVESIASRDLLTRSNLQTQKSLNSLKDSLVSFTNPMNRLTDSVKRMDETNRKMSQMGTTFSKFQTSLEKNSKVLDQNSVSNRALVSELAQNFEQGVRINNGALTKLTKEMIATGQNTAGLRKLNSSLVLQTGNNTDAVQQINKTNKDVSDKYGISNQRLIESLNSLKGVMDQASFFGPQAVASLGDISTQLMGRAGGTDIQGALGTLGSLLTGGSENLAASRLLGAGGLRQKIAGGQAIGMEDLAPIFQNLDRIVNSFGNHELGPEMAARSMGLNKQQMVQLKQLHDISKNNFELDKDAVATEAEKANSLANIQERAKNFYDNTAVMTLATIAALPVGIVTAMAGAGMVRGGIAGATGLLTSGKSIPVGGKHGSRSHAMFGKGNREATFGRGMKGGIAGLMAGQATSMIGDAAGFDLGGASTGMTVGAGLGSVIPGVGTLVGGAAGGVIGLISDIVKNTGESAEAEKERLEMEKEEANKKRAEESSKDIARLTSITGWARSRFNFTGNAEVEVLLKDIYSQLRVANERKASEPRSAIIAKK